VVWHERDSTYKCLLYLFSSIVQLNHSTIGEVEEEKTISARKEV